MNNFHFVKDLREEIGSLSEVDSISFKFESYDFEVINGEKFIVGKVTKESLIENESKDKELLFSLINLVKDPLTERFDVPTPHINKLDTIIHDENILKWVKEYGIPYRDKELNRLLDDETWRINYLHVDTFRFQLAKLYARFSIWKSIIEDEPKKIDNYIMSLLTINLKAWKDLKKNTTEYLPVVKKALAQEVGIGAGVNIRLKYDNNIDQNVFILSTDSLLSIAYYHLSALMTKPYSESKKSLKYCKMCNSIFWASHKNSDYCSSFYPESKCNKQRHYYQRNKNKRKKHDFSQ